MTTSTPPQPYTADRLKNSTTSVDVNALGKHGTNVVVRLSAFLLLCIGIQIVWTGFSELPVPPAWSH